MTIGPDRLSKAETMTVAAIEAGAAMLVEARDLTADFQAMVRERSADDLDLWLERAKPSLIASFASGVVKDEAAVRAAMTLSWPMARPKVKSPSCSSSNAKCMGAESSISSRLASSAPLDRWRHQNCVRAQN
jgi:hypothetical protein